MNVIIIEDETAAVKNLETILKGLRSDITIMATLDTVKDSIQWLNNNAAPDLIFLDIHLADGQSFLIFEEVEIKTPIIFTTAYDQYAMDAFKVNSIDYLLKPINPDDVLKALNKFETLTNSEIKQYAQQLNSYLQPNSYSKTLLIAKGDKLFPLNTSEILYAISKNETTIIHTTAKQQLTYNKSLETLINKLNPNQFFRANRQFIVAHQAITEVTLWFHNRLVLKLSVPTDEKIIISKAKVAEFKKWLTNN